MLVESGIPGQVKRHRRAGGSEPGRASRPRRLLGALFTSALLLLALASSSSALSTGVMWSGDINQNKSPAEMEVVQRSGSTVYRVGISHDEWNARGASFYDGIFQKAGEKGLTILPYLVDGGYPDQSTEPAKWAMWAAWTKEMVKRYGYSGTFWAGKPYYKPVTAWEVGNEPNLSSENFGGVVNAERYGKLLVHASSSIRAAQKEQSGGGTTVLMGGLLLSLPNWENFFKEAWNVPGVSSAFDGLSIHPYAFESTIGGFKSEVSAARTLLTGKAGSGRPLWITEMGWPVGGTGPGAVPIVSEANQAKLLNESFDWVQAEATNKNIQSIIWYNLRDDPTQNIWQHRIGLLTSDRRARPAWYAFQEQAGAPKWTPPAEMFRFDDNLPGPHMVGMSNGSIDGFYRTASGALGHTWTQSGPWSSQDIAGTSLNSTSVPHPVIQDTGAIDVFWRTPTSGLGHAWNDAGGWHAETLAGTLASEPHAVVQNNGTIDVFYRTPSNELGHNWYQPGGQWLSNTVATSVASDPYPVAQINGWVDVYYRTTSDGLGHAGSQGGSWVSGEVAGTAVSSTSSPRPVVQYGNTIDVFWRTPSGGVGHAWSTNASNGLHPETLSGSAASDIYPVVQPNGTIDVFYRTPSNELGHNWYQPGGQWLSNTVVTSLASDPYPVAQYNGTIDVFYRTTGGGIGHAWTQGGTWSSGTLASSPDASSVPHALAQPNGTIDVLFRTAGGEIGHDWYQGQWYNSPVERTWAMRNANSAGNPDLSFWYRWPTEKAVVGDWDGNGTATPGTYDSATGTWRLRNSSSGGLVDIEFQYGGSQYIPVVGDWDGNKTTTIGLYDPSTGNWALRNSNSSGAPDYSFAYGGAAWGWTSAVAGDWDGNKTSTIGLYDPSTGNWALRNSNSSGAPDYSFAYGGAAWGWTSAVAGDWDGNKTSTIGLYDPSTGNWVLRNSNSSGAPDYSFAYGGPMYDPVVGDWDGNGTSTVGVATRP